MAKGLIGGMTDYSHQSFKDILGDLDFEYRNLSAFIGAIEKNISESIKNDYWNNKVPSSFIAIIEYSL